MGAEKSLCISAAVLVFAALITNSQGIKCYVCNSAFQKECANFPVPEDYLVTCSPSTASPLQPPTNEHSHDREVSFSAPKDTNFTFCRKNVVTIPTQINGNSSRPEEVRIIRACGYIDKDSTSNCKWGANHGIQNYICVCNGEACNSANSFSWRTIQGILTLLTFFSIAKWAI